MRLMGIVVIDRMATVDEDEWASVGRRLRTRQPLIYERLLAMARRSLLIEESPLVVAAGDLEISTAAAVMDEASVDA